MCTTFSGSKPRSRAHWLQTRATAGVESMSTPSMSNRIAAQAISTLSDYQRKQKGEQGGCPTCGRIHLGPHQDEASAVKCGNLSPQARHPHLTLSITAPCLGTVAV